MAICAAQSDTVCRDPKMNWHRKSRAWVPKGAFMWCCTWGSIPASLANVVTQAKAWCWSYYAVSCFYCMEQRNTHFLFILGLSQRPAHCFHQQKVSPGHSHQRALHPQPKLVQRTKGTSDKSGPCKKWASFFAYLQQREQPPQSPPTSALLQTAGSLSPAFPSSPSLRWVGRRTQHGVTGNCLSTQEQDTKTSPAGLPGWISSQEHGFPHE